MAESFDSNVASDSSFAKINIATGVVTTLGLVGADGSSGIATSFEPRGISTDGTNLFVTDKKNREILRIVISTGTISVLAGSTDVGNYVDGVGMAARFFSPNTITTDGTNLYITETSVVRKIVIATGVVSTVAGKYGTFGKVNEVGTAASFGELSGPGGNNIGGIAIDGANLYVAENVSVAGYFSDTRKIVIATGAVSTYAGILGTPCSDDGSATTATFTKPAGLASFGGSLFVIDTGVTTVRKIR